MLAMIVPDTINPFFASLARAVENAAAERGYALLLANSRLAAHRAPPHQELRRAAGWTACSSPACCSSPI